MSTRITRSQRTPITGAKSSSCHSMGLPSTQIRALVAAAEQVRAELRPLVVRRPLAPKQPAEPGQLVAPKQRAVARQRVVRRLSAARPAFHPTPVRPLGSLAQVEDEYRR